MSTFNQEQQAAVESMMRFLDSKEQYFLLSGSAGTGKTFCIQYLIECLPKLKVILTAPTNKATKVLKTTLTRDGYFPLCKTTYSLLGLQLAPTGEIKELRVSERRKDLTEYKVIIVDEASMISMKLWEHIQQASDEFRLKFIFMGDRSQLPPVKEAFSPIWEYITSKADLTQVMRFDNQILTLATRIRAEVDKMLPSIKLLNDNDEIEGVWYDSSTAFVNKMRTLARAGEFNNPERLVKAIAWRNAVVKDMNLLIRGQIFDNSKDSVWLAGDRIILTAPANGLEGEQIACTDEEGTIERVSVAQHPTQGDYKCWCLEVIGDNNKQLQLWVLHESEERKYQNQLANMALEARAIPRKWKDYWEFADTFHKIQYGYAITAHRAQGSTYHTAFVDWRDILSNRNRNEGFRCFYVAATRPKKKLILGSM